MDEQGARWFAGRRLAWARNRLGRRAFLQLCGALGLGSAGAVLFGRDLLHAPSTSLADQQRHTLGELGQQVAGTTVGVASKRNALSQAIAALAQAEFVPLTGVELRWDMLPLEQLLDAAAREAEEQAGTYDALIWDQAWLGALAPHAHDLRPLLHQAPWALPGYDYEDFLPPLRARLAEDHERVIGIPFDIPIFLLVYRHDVLAELGLRVPRTLSDYRAAGLAITAEGGPALYGLLGQRLPGHYALLCEAAAWLWGFGGAFFGADGRPTINDDAALAAFDYMLSLSPAMPPAVGTWDWWDAAAALGRGQVGMGLFWSAFLPSLMNPAESPVAQQFALAPCPAELPPRPASACGFGETPGVSRQNGSVLALSRYTRKLEAAWLFVQWATSADVLARASLISGATPVRASSYSALPSLARRYDVPLNTQHLALAFDAIGKHMGSEPRLPRWPRVAVDQLAQQLGRMTSGQQDVHSTARAMARALAPSTLG